MSIRDSTLTVLHLEIGKLVLFVSVQIDVQSAMEQQLKANPKEQFQIEIINAIDEFLIFVLVLILIV